MLYDMPFPRNPTRRIMCIVQVNLKMLLDIFSDARVVAPLLRAANLHSGNQRASYLYIFDHVTQNGYYPPQVLLRSNQ